MATAATFKQPCPSCEAMVTIKENMVGKKVECTKCKDKFVAEKPAQEKKQSTAISKKDATQAKKNTSLQKKVETGVTSKAPPPGKKSKMMVEELEVDELDIEELEDEEEPVQVKASKGKAATNGNGKSKPALPGKGKADAPTKSNGKAKKVEDDEDEEEEEDEKASKKAKKKAVKSNKLTMGLALAVVGVLVLCVAAYFLLRRPSPRPNGDNPLANNSANPGGAPKGNNTGSTPGTGGNTGKDDKKVPDPIAIPLTEVELARLTHLLPNDTEHVFHLFFDKLFSPAGVLRDAAFQSPGALDDVEIKKRIGFSLLAIDDMMRAERYTPAGWTYTVIHFKEILREDDLKAALKLKPLTSDGQTYYQTTEANPWLEPLARFSFGLPNPPPILDARGVHRPTFVRVHNQQTLILGDEAPIVALLSVRGQFPPLTTKTATPPPKEVPKEVPKDVTMPPGGMMGGGPKPPAPPAPPAPGGTTGFLFPPEPGPGVLVQPLQPATVAANRDEQALAQQPSEGDGCQTNPSPNPIPGGDPMANPNTPPAASPAREDMYLTIKPSLKAILDRMETKGPDNRGLVLFSSATDMDANRVDTNNLPEYRERVVRRPRQFWDVTLLLTETKPHIRMLGTALLQRERDSMKFQYRNELICAQKLDAEEFLKEINERTAYNVARFIFNITRHEMRLPSDKPPPAKDPPAQPPTPNPDPKANPEEKKLPTEATVSQISVNQQFSTVEFVMDLVLDNPTLTRIVDLASLQANALRVEMEAAASPSWRHALAGAGKTLGKEGLSERGVPKDNFPPGAFLRADAPLRLDREPKNRISWMAGLLPYLGHQNLFSRIKFEQSWREPGNWMTGRTIVPQFLDPTYPEHLRQVAVGDLPVDFGATHFVGIAGVGLDAASYKRGHPSTAFKQGIFSYDGSASLTEVRQGNGLANTIMMIQVPHDSLTGVSPWIAGGGATLRGVPEERSIAPFVLSKDRDGNYIRYQKKRGTYALMADGSVRFVSEDVSDDVFKAMCTVAGPVPKNFDLNKDPNTPLIIPSSKNGKKPADKPALKPAPEKKPVVEIIPKKADDPLARHQGAGRIHNKNAGFSMVLPSGWEMIKSEGNALMTALGPNDGGFVSNLVVRQIAYDGTPIEKISQEVKRGRQQIKTWKFIDEALLAIDGKKAYMLCGRTAGTVESSNLQYLIIGGNNQVYVLTYTTAAVAFEPLRKGLEQSALSARTD